MNLAKNKKRYNKISFSQSKETIAFLRLYYDIIFLKLSTCINFKFDLIILNVF